MTEEQAKEQARVKNEVFEPDRGCPFKTACVSNCPAFIKSRVVKTGTSDYSITETGCLFVKTAKKLLGDKD